MSTRVYPSRSKELVDAFMADDTNECQIWPMSLNGSGYPQMSWEGKPRLVSHIVWELDGRETPGEGEVRTRTCNRKNCVNLNHCELSVQGDYAPVERTRLTRTEKALIRRRWKYGYSKNQIALELGRSWQAVHYIITGKRG